jgi:hypothetical protein
MHHKSSTFTCTVSPECSDCFSPEVLMPVNEHAPLWTMVCLGRELYFRRRISVSVAETVLIRTGAAAAAVFCADEPVYSSSKYGS